MNQNEYIVTFSDGKQVSEKAINIRVAVNQAVKQYKTDGGVTNVIRAVQVS